MSYRRMTPEMYNAAVAYFRDHPGDCRGAAQAAGCYETTAERWWKGPKSQYNPWATPIRELFVQEKLAAAAAKKAQEDAARSMLAEEQAKSARLEEEAQRVEEGIMRLARSDVLGALGGLSRLTQGVNKLAERINKQLETGVDASGHPIEINVGDALRILQRYSQSVRGMVEAASVLIGIERVKKNLPTSIVGIEVGSITLADAMEQHSLAGDMLRRAKALGLVVDAPEDDPYALPPQVSFAQPPGISIPPTPRVVRPRSPAHPGTPQGAGGKFVKRLVSQPTELDP